MFYFRFKKKDFKKMSEALIFAHSSFLVSDVSESLSLLRGNELHMWANCSFCSPKMSEWVNCSFFGTNRSFAHFWTKNKRFARKLNERIPSPAPHSIYPSLTSIGHAEDCERVALPVGAYGLVLLHLLAPVPNNHQRDWRHCAREKHHELDWLHV